MLSSSAARKRPIVVLAVVLCLVSAGVARFGFITGGETRAQAPKMFDPSATIVVNDTTDTIHSPGCATTGTGTCSLRDAILFTNAATAAGGGTNTITLGAGTFNLSITGSGENAAATGDLDILAPPTGFINTLNINGAGAASTIIQWSPAVPAASRDRIIDAHPNAPPNGSIILSISGITFTGGNSVTSSGGVMLTGRPGDVTNLTNSVFDSNTAFTNGGVISQSSSAASHDLTITNCVFNNNLAGGGGGAVNYSGLGTVTITNSTFSNNRTGPVGANTGGSGGALSTSGGGNGGTYNVSRNVFINNQVLNSTAQGGAVINTNGTLNISFNRFSGNTVPTPANGITLAQTGGATVNVINANDNWWGQNSGPVANDAVVLAAGGTINLTTWLQLRHSASPSAVLIGGTSTLTADILGRNLGGPIAPANLTGLPAFPSPAGTIFGNPQKGTLSVVSTQFVNGQATATFTAGNVSASCGAGGGADATADSQTINAAITVQCPDLTIAKSNNVANNAVVGQPWTWTLTVSNGGNANAVFSSGQTIFTDNLPNGANITYGTPTTAANATCTINGTKDLSCTANAGGVTIAPVGSITVTVTGTGTAPATQANPRGGGNVTVDSGASIVESNEGNNTAASNTVTVGKANTTASITNNPATTVVGQAYTVNFSVSVTAPGSATPTAPTGNVQVSDGSQTCLGAINAGGTGSCSLTSTTAGNKTLTATYQGDTNFNASLASTGVAHTVNKADTTASISADTPDPSNVGQNVTVTYSVAVTAPGVGTPGGNVVVSDGTTICTGTVAAGQCTGPMNTAGSRNITATYQGDTNFNASPASANAPHVVGQVTWTGASSTAFAANTNWNTGLAPGSGDTAIIPTGATNQPTISGATSLASLSVASGRTLTVNNALTVSGTLTNNGTINGTGTIINNFSNAGTIAPGLSPGILNITGTYANPGTLNIEIGGTGGPGVNPNGHDQLLVSGTATLGGTLNVTLTNGFTPAPGNSFLILDTASSTGTFATTNLPNIGTNTWNVAYNNANGTVTLTVVAPTAANVGVSGRVLTSEGRGVSKARVTLTDSGGDIVYSMTNSFGYYRFVNVGVGQTYVIAVRSKQYQFTPRTIQVSEELTDVDFIADPEN